MEPLAQLAPSLKSLCAAVGAPVTSHPAWLLAWAAAAGSAAQPWTLLAWKGGQLAGAAMLATRGTEAGLLVSTVRPHSDDVVVFPALSDEAAWALAQAVSQHLEAERGPWRLELAQVSTDDRLAGRLSELLPGAHVGGGRAVPRVAFGRSRDPNAYLSKSTRTALRRARARLLAAGVAGQLEIVDQAPAIISLLPQIEAIHVERDHDQGRVSDLDDPANRSFWREVIATFARASRLKLFVLRIEADIAAYAVVLLDGSAHRVFDGRLAPRWASFAPGRLVEAAVLEHALAMPPVRELDWMSSVAPGSLLAMTDARPTLRITCEAGLGARPDQS